MDPTPFLTRLAGLDAAWGSVDCALVVADYLVWARRMNRDPAEDIRGTYTTEEECHAMLKREGGLLRLLRRRADELGLERVDVVDPPPGACGVVRWKPEGLPERHFGGIITLARRAAIKCSDGLVYTRGARPIALWMP